MGIVTMIEKKNKRRREREIVNLYSSFQIKEGGKRTRTLGFREKSLAGNY